MPEEQLAVLREELASLCTGTANDQYTILATTMIDSNVLRETAAIAIILCNFSTSLVN